MEILLLIFLIYIVGQNMLLMSLEKKWKKYTDMQIELLKLDIKQYLKEREEWEKRAGFKPIIDSNVNYIKQTKR